MNEPQVEVARTPEASAERIRIQLLEERDAEGFFRLIDANREHLSQHGDASILANMHLENALAWLRQKGERDYRYGVWQAGRLIGFVILTEFSSKMVEIGYFLEKEAEGKGVMSQAASAMRDYAIKSLGYEEVLAWVREGNEKSAAVLNRIGFERMDPQFDRIVELDGVQYADSLYTYEEVTKDT